LDVAIPRPKTVSTAATILPKMDEMKTIGLVGGVASGKSVVSRMLVEFGAGLLDADRTGHAVLAEEAEVRQALRKRWGDSILTPKGEVDRAAVARRVFANDSSGQNERKFLEALVHPRIQARLSQLQDKLAAEGKPAVVLDAPLLLEAGWGSLCDFVLFVDVSVEKRLERAKTRGWTNAEFTRRESAQWPVAEKRRHATQIFPNFGTEAELREAVRKFWTENIGPISVNR
jgi:dephospho-CoA kinase